MITIQAILAKYAMQILGGMLATAVVIGGYYYWKHEVITIALTKQTANLREQSETLLRQKNKEVQDAENKIRERATNAIQTYAKHYDELRAAANRIPERVFITTKTNCNSDSMPGAGESRAKVAPGIERTGKAELPDANIRQLNEVIARIEDMQLKCERLLNTVE